MPTSLLAEQLMSAPAAGTKLSALLMKAAIAKHYCLDL